MKLVIGFIIWNERTIIMEISFFVNLLMSATSVFHREPSEFEE